MPDEVVVKFPYGAVAELADAVELVPFPEGREVVLTLNVAFENIGVTTSDITRWYSFPEASRPLRYIKKLPGVSVRSVKNEFAGGSPNSPLPAVISTVRISEPAGVRKSNSDVEKLPSIPAMAAISILNGGRPSIGK